MKNTDTLNHPSKHPEWMMDIVLATIISAVSLIWCHKPFHLLLIPLTVAIIPLLFTCCRLVMDGCTNFGDIVDDIISGYYTRDEIGDMELTFNDPSKNTKFSDFSNRIMEQSSTYIVTGLLLIILVSLI